MSESEETPEPGERPDPQVPYHGTFRIDHRTARVPEEVGGGVFANALMVAAGPLEFILDFVQRLGEPGRVVARVVMPPTVAAQFVGALRHNIGRYEAAFGAIPPLPLPPQDQAPQQAAESADEERDPDEPPPYQDNPAYGGLFGPGAGVVGPGIEEGQAAPAPGQRPIEDIYDELKMDDSLLSGRYANAVMVRHTPAEFAFEFITRFMPHSAVSNKVVVAAPNVPSMLASIERSVHDYQSRQRGGRGDLPPPSEN